MSGASSCSPCQAGTFAAENSGRLSTCVACLAGSYASSNGSATCFPCAPVTCFRLRGLLTKSFRGTFLARPVHRSVPRALQERLLRTQARPRVKPASFRITRSQPARNSAALATLVSMPSSRTSLTRRSANVNSVPRVQAVRPWPT
jgi:hypothetical protein